jgi:hypothetical protein
LDITNHNSPVISDHRLPVILMFLLSIGIYMDYFILVQSLPAAYKQPIVTLRTNVWP